MKNFIVYNASAGSGKTTILSIEYIILTLQNPEKFKRVLAVTFTNKAASEMKERIISYLKSIASGKIEEAKPLFQNLNYIRERTSLSDEQIQKRAEITLQNILHNYSDFAVKTIDSFIHRIVRTFAYDLHLPIDFEIETDSDKLLNQAVDILISKAGIEEDLTEALVEFTEVKTNDDKSWHIEGDLFEFSKVLLDEEGQINTDKLKNLSIKDFEKIRKNILSFFDFFRTELLKLAEPVVNQVSSIGITPQAFAGGKNGIMKFFEYVIRKRFDKLEPSSTVQKNMNEDKWYSAKATPEEKGKIDTLKPLINEAYIDIKSFSEEYQSKYLVLELVYRKLYPLAVLNETDKILNEIKSQNNLMHISDFNKKVSQIVLSEPIPFIYERVGERFEHFFIDEFQDTSVMQWQNMLPLIDNSLASDNFNMVVGDGKQAIYRWRNGNVEQFINLPNIDGQQNNEVIAERAATLHRNIEKIELDTNYRSKQEIVEFNNAFFNHLAELLPENYKPIYKNLSQKHKRGDGGLVSIEFIDESNEIYEQSVFEKVESLIHLLSENYQLKDIGILCRSNREANGIAEYLLLKGIDVVSSESLLLCNSEEINFLISLIKIVASPKDTISVISAVRFLSHKSKSKDLNIEIEEKLESIKNNDKIDILDILLKKYISYEKGFENDLTFLSLYDLCEYLIREFRLDKQNDPFIVFFLDMVWEYSSQKSTELKGFIDWWEENKHKQFITVPQGLEAVNIMTIHKSKGLQFPVVIYPFADNALKATKSNLWIDSSYEELGEIKNPIVNSNKQLLSTQYGDLYTEEQDRSLLDLVNILYVSLTRPEEQLYIFSKLPGDAEKNSIPSFFRSFLMSVNKWKSNDYLYMFGIEATTRKKVESISMKSTIYKHLISNNWQGRIRISQNADLVWDIENPKNKRKWGNIMHSVLAMINYTDDLEFSLQKAQNKGLINEGQRGEINTKIESLFKNTEIASFFNKNLKIITEKEILAKDGKAYCPDRVVIDGKRTILVDFKTGKEEEKHKMQIERYAKLLSDMGYRNIETYLLYIEDEILIAC